MKLYEKSPVKRAFLKDVCSKLSIKAQICNNIYEEVIDSDYIVARAFKKLEAIIQVSREIVKKSHKLIILKGRNAQKDLEKAFKIKTGSFFGQTFLGKMSEADKQRNIQNLKDQRLRYESQLSELDSASMRDIGAEKRNNEKNIEETKIKIKSTDEMKYNASQLYQ